MYGIIKLICRNTPTSLIIVFVLDLSLSPTVYNVEVIYTISVPTGNKAMDNVSKGITNSWTSDNWVITLRMEALQDAAKWSNSR